MVSSSVVFHLIYWNSTKGVAATLRNWRRNDRLELVSAHRGRPVSSHQEILLDIVMIYSLRAADGGDRPTFHPSGPAGCSARPDGGRFRKSETLLTGVVPAPFFFCIPPSDLFIHSSRLHKASVGNDADGWRMTRFRTSETLHSGVVLALLYFLKTTVGLRGALFFSRTPGPHSWDEFSSETTSTATG